MKTITRDLSYLQHDIKIIPFADFHIGDPNCNIKLIKELIKEVKNDPYCFCLLGGDLMDSATKSSIGDSYNARMSPADQLDCITELLEPLASQGKILAAVGGNHEARIKKETSYDPTYLLCKNLGIEDVYSEETIVGFLKVGRKKSGGNKPFLYGYYLTHGHGGGRKVGGKVNTLESLASIIVLDIYFCGHTHLPVIFKEDRFVVNYTNQTVSQIRQTFVNTSSALRYGGYGEIQGYAPAANAYPKVILNGTVGTKKIVKGIL